MRFHSIPPMKPDFYHYCRYCAPPADIVRTIGTAHSIIYVGLARNRLIRGRSAAYSIATASSSRPMGKWTIIGWKRPRKRKKSDGEPAGKTFKRRMSPSYISGSIRHRCGPVRRKKNGNGEWRHAHCHARWKKAEARYPIGPQARTCFTMLPCTSVNRYRRPRSLNDNRS